MRRTLIFCLLVLLSTSLMAQVEEKGTVVETLRNMFPDVTIKVDPTTYALIIEATPEDHRRILEVIKSLDLPPRQITIVAKFIEIIVTDIGELGIEWTGLTSTFYGDEAGWASEGYSPNSEASALLRFPPRALTMVEGVLTEGSIFRYTRLDPTQFRILLHALEKEEKANLLSEPRVTTLNHQEATIHVTKIYPYATNVTYRTKRVYREGREYTEEVPEYDLADREVGITLDVTPHVPEGSDIITLHILPTVESMVERVTVAVGIPEAVGRPVIDTRYAETTIMLKSGETIVLGGLIRDEDKKIKRQVPFLGSIPLLGRLFRTEYTKSEKNNLLIFITAYLVDERGRMIIS